MPDSVKNFARSDVSTGYDAAATSIVLATGGGARFPAAPFNVVWWDRTTYPDPSDDPNVEIVRVTAIASDTLTVTRAQEGTSASTKNTAGKTYRMMLAATAKSFSDLAGGGAWTWDVAGGKVRLTTATDLVGVGQCTSPTAALEIERAAIGQTLAEAYGLLLDNPTASTSASANQHAPPITWRGSGWRSEGSSGAKVCIARLALEVPNAYNGDGVGFQLAIAGNDGQGGATLTTAFTFALGFGTAGYFSATGQVAAPRFYLTSCRGLFSGAEHGSNDYDGGYFDLRSGTKVWYGTAGVGAGAVNGLFFPQGAWTVSGKMLGLDAKVSGSYNGSGDTAPQSGDVGADATQTTDATTATVFSWPLADDTVYLVEVAVAARRTDAAGRWTGKRRATVYRAGGGGATLEGSAEVVGTDVANGIAPTVTIDVSSNDVRVRVTGEAAKTIKWKPRVSILAVST